MSDVLADGNASYVPWLAYGRSKLASVLFTAALAHRLRADRVFASAFRPGGVSTNLRRHAAAAAAAAGCGGAMPILCACACVRVCVVLGEQLERERVWEGRGGAALPLPRVRKQGQGAWLCTPLPAPPRSIPAARSSPIA
jgi:NAD(P)-dependent dehydrogenase (short-subunit alcohol dehydrogenase family)